MIMIDTIAEWDHFAAEHRTWLGLSTAVRADLRFTPGGDR